MTEEEKIKFKDEFEEEYSRYIRGECVNYNQSMMDALRKMKIEKLKKQLRLQRRLLQHVFVEYQRLLAEKKGEL